MPFANNFNAVNFINKSVQPTGTPDIDAAFLNYFQGIVDAQGDGLASYSSDLEALEATVSSLGNPYTNPGFIEGLNVQWESNTQIRVKSGACYVPATGNIASKSTDSVLTPTGLAADTLYYLYAADVGGSLVFDNASITAPALYRGNAKQKSGDSSRRYIGEFRTALGSTNIVRFTESNGKVIYQTQGAAVVFTAPWVVLDNKQGTTNTTISLAGLVPALTKFAFVHSINYSNQQLLIGIPGTLSNSAFNYYLESNTSSDFFDLPIDSSLQTAAKLDAATTNGSGAYIGLMGYWRER